MLFLLLLADKREREAIAVAREYGNYCTKEQNKVIDELLQGTQNKDEEMVCLHYQFTYVILYIDKNQVIEIIPLSSFDNLILCRVNGKYIKHYKTKP